MKIRILIIENQIVQFRKIRDLLPSNKYACVLKEEDYKDFMEALFVMLGPTVNMEEYQERCRQKVLDKIVALKPDIIIMDYKLCGSEDAKNGVGCAEIILDSYRKENPCPVLFLSRVAENEKRRTEDYNEFKSKHKDYVDWINKGFYGDRILDSSYNSKITDALDKLWNSSIPKKVMDALEVLKGKQSYKDSLKNALSTLYNQMENGLSIEHIPKDIVNLLLKKKKEIVFEKPEEMDFIKFVNSLTKNG